MSGRPDKFFKCWRLLYALATRTPANVVLAEIGVTGKPLQELVDRLRNVRAADHNTKIGRYLAQVQGTGAACYLWQSENYCGNLNDMDIIKARWVASGQSVGIVFPQRPSLLVFRDPLETMCRVWPDFGAIASVGLRIR
jgi:hypothetical protein